MTTNTQPPDLEQVAQSKYGPLSDAEISLVRAAKTGSTAYCGPTEQDDDPVNDPGNSSSWGPERVIRAELIAALAIDPDLKSWVDSKGLRVHGARISGRLDLSQLVLNWPISLFYCRLEDDADLHLINIPDLDLSNSHIADLNLERANIKGGLTLPFLHASGVMRLDRAHIGADLDLSNGHFTGHDNDSGTAIYAAEATIGGAALFGGLCVEEGSVILVGASVGTAVKCSEAAFRNPFRQGELRSGLAIDASNLRVSTDVFFDGGFQAEGAVVLFGARIGGSLICGKARFQANSASAWSYSGVAIDASNLNVFGTVFLNDRFQANGSVKLFSASIGKNMVCSGGIFFSSPQNGENYGPALDADSAAVAGSVYLDSGFSAIGTVQLYRAQIGGELNCDGGSFSHAPVPEGGASGFALSADWAKVAGSVRLSNKFSSTGAVSFFGAQVGGFFDCTAGKIQNSALKGNPGSGLALDATSINVSGEILLRDGFAAKGKVSLYNATVGQSLDCRAATIWNPPQPAVETSGWALDLSNANVSRTVFLGEKLTVDGAVVLYAAQIGSDLNCSGSTFLNPFQQGVDASRSALDATAAKVGGSAFLTGGFSAQGAVIFSRAQVSGVMDCRSARFDNVPQTGAPRDAVALNADGIKVEKDIYLCEIDAQGMVRLYAADIRGNLELDGARIENPKIQGIEENRIALNVENAKIAGDVYLRRVMADSSVISDEHPHKNFEAIGTVRFYGADIKGDFECEGGIFESLDLTNASVRSIMDEREAWPAPGKLGLDGFTYGRIAYGPSTGKERLEWLALQKEFNRQPYRQLASVLKESADDKGWRQVCIEMERRARSAERSRGVQTGVRRIGSWLLRWTIGYGYAPRRAMVWIMVLVIFGSIVYQLGFNKGNIVPADKDAFATFSAHKPLPENYQGFSAILYSLDNSFPVVKLGIQDKWIPRQGVRTANPQPAWSLSRLSSIVASSPFLQIFHWIQIGLGWILGTMFAIGISGVVRSD